MATNRLHNASESLWELLAASYDTDDVLRIKRHVINVLHTDETTSENNPNHPYGRFGSAHDSIGNRTRLRDSIYAEVSNESNVLNIAETMFDASSGFYPAVIELLRRYKNYVSEMTNSNSDGDSDSDSD